MVLHQRTEYVGITLAHSMVGALGGQTKRLLPLVKPKSKITGNVLSSRLEAPITDTYAENELRSFRAPGNSLRPCRCS